MKKGILSPFSYFGGKAEMAGLISEMLNYSVETYIEPFGGACRTLLNKPRHSLEIYNDYSLGLCAFFNLMSGNDTSEELIKRLYQTKYDRVEFNKALACRRRYNDTPFSQVRREFTNYIKEIFVKYDVLPDENSYIETKKIINNMYEFKIILGNIMPLMSREEQLILLQSLDGYDTSKGTFDNIEALKEKKIIDGEIVIKNKIIDLPDNWSNTSIDDYLNNYDLAVATFVSYAQSRDGMGNYFSTVKYKSQEDYIRKIDKLYDVAERMQGVYIFGAENALVFLKVDRYINNENVQFYLDPSYLKPEDEYKNLGTSYDESFGYKDHKAMLELIQNARAKILISNYDVKLYNSYLTPDLGWKKYEYKTKTSLAIDGDRERIEVLWYNY